MPHSISWKMAMQSQPSDRPAKPTVMQGNEEASKLNAVGLYVLSVAHDLGNLVQIIGSAVRIIERSIAAERHADLDPVFRGALTSIDQASILARRIIETGKPSSIAVETLDLDTLLTEMGSVIVLAAGTGVEVTLSIGSDIPAISCCRDELENAILNLVLNARDAIGGGGQIVLTAMRDPASALTARHPYALISVTDNGCGMSEEVAAKAFNPFFTTKTSGRGTGLGLAAIATFANGLGGSVGIKSAVGTGTTVTLLLPGSDG